MYRNLYLKLGFIVLLIVFAAWRLYPPHEQLKGGIDLVGGAALVYEIDDTGLDSAQKRDLAERMIRILKERVDPNQVLNLEWRPIGQNRIEIRMPQPPAEASKLRQEYQAARDALMATAVHRGEIELAMSYTGEARERA